MQVVETKIEDMQAILERFESVLKLDDFKNSDEYFLNSLMLVPDQIESIFNRSNPRFGYYMPSQHEILKTLLKDAETYLELDIQRDFFKKVIEQIQSDINNLLQADIDFSLFYENNFVDGDLHPRVLFDSFQIADDLSCEICGNENNEHHLLPVDFQTSRESFGGFFIKTKNENGRETVAELNLASFCICKKCYDFMTTMQHRLTDNLKINIKINADDYDCSDDLPF